MTTHAGLLTRRDLEPMILAPTVQIQIQSTPPPPQLSTPSLYLDPLQCNKNMETVVRQVCARPMRSCAVVYPRDRKKKKSTEESEEDQTGAEWKREGGAGGVWGGGWVGRRSAALHLSNGSFYLCFFYVLQNASLNALRSW